jgi:hypothetical protein
MRWVHPSNSAANGPFVLHDPSIMRGMLRYARLHIEVIATVDVDQEFADVKDLLMFSSGYNDNPQALTVATELVTRHLREWDDEYPIQYTGGKFMLSNEAVVIVSRKYLNWI